MKHIKMIGVMIAMILLSVVNTSCGDEDEVITVDKYESAIVGLWMEYPYDSESDTWEFMANGKGKYVDVDYEYGTETSDFTYHFTSEEDFVLRIWGTSLHCTITKLTKNELTFFMEEEGKGPKLKRKK